MVSVALAVNIIFYAIFSVKLSDLFESLRLRNSWQ